METPRSRPNKREKGKAKLKKRRKRRRRNGSGRKGSGSRRPMEVSALATGGAKLVKMEVVVDDRWRCQH